MSIQVNKFSPIIVCTLLLSASFAHAGGHRPDTRTMSCGAAKSLVQSRGAVLLSTGNYTYDKFVRNHAYCNIDEALKRAYVPTGDQRRCNVGYICKDKLDF
jgi:hypothetical protein